MMVRKIVMGLLAAAFIAAVSNASHAAGLKRGDMDAGDDFANSETVTDGELAKNRGGFINIHGMLIDLTFYGTASVNGNIVSQIQMNMSDIINAAQNNPNGFIQPTVIQNVDPNALIAVQQILDLQIIGAEGVINNAAQFNQAAFQNVIAFR